MLNIINGKIDLKQLKREIEEEIEEIQDMQEWSQEEEDKAKLLRYREREEALRKLQRRLFGKVD